MADKHPIEGIMYTAMQSLKDMIDVNTIVGDAVKTPDGTVIIPISKVGLGFGVGGSEFGNEKKVSDSASNSKFGGGSGGGISINPVAFLVVGNGQIRLMPVSPETNVYDRVLDMIPTAIDKISDGIEKHKAKKAESAENKTDNNVDLSNSENNEPPSVQVNVNEVEPPVFTNFDTEN